VHSTAVAALASHASAGSLGSSVVTVFLRLPHDVDEHSGPISIQIKAPYAFTAQLHGQSPPLRKNGRIDEIAAFLEAAELGPEDRVQPLDWTEGALQGMLLAEAVIATLYLYNYHFYHYISDPYINIMKNRFMADLELNPPRFIIETDDELRPSGLDTTDQFPALEAFVDRNYAVVKQGHLYRIYEYQAPLN
jgi:hypothetical protein